MTNPTVYLSRTGFLPIVYGNIYGLPDIPEIAQDAVGGILTDTATIDFTYSDVTPSITADLKNTTVIAGTYGSASRTVTYTVDAQGRLTASTDQLIAIVASQVSDFNEAAQDAVGGILTDTATIDLTYTDGAGTITADLKALTGDITTVAGFPATTLATVNANVGTFGTASQTSTFTVNAKGLITAASNTAIAITASQVSDFNEAAQDAVGGILTDTATIDFTYNDAGNAITADLKNTTVVAGTYTEATITVDAQGRLTAAASKANFTSSDQTITSGGALTLAHGLASAPFDLAAFLVNQTAQFGFVAGDTLAVPLGGGFGGGNKGLAVQPDATNLNIKIGSAASSFDIIRKDTGAQGAITNANWKLRFYAAVRL